MHTIEAAILTPLAMMVSVFILFAGIILYDRTAADYALESALIRGSEHSEMNNDELLHYVEDEFLRLLEGRLIMADGSLNVSVRYDSISAEYTGSVRLPKLPAFAAFSSSLSTDIYSSNKIIRLRRSKICRAVSALKNSGN